MNVIDASSLTKYVLREDNWIEVREILEEETISIDLVVKEVANAIWKKAIVLGLETIDYAWKRYNILKKIIGEQIVIIEDESKYLDLAFQIALNNNITIYDALYIAQALKLKATLVTSDRRQGEVSRKLGVETYYIP